jgi:hypothetical protein
MNRRQKNKLTPRYRRAEDKPERVLLIILAVIVLLFTAWRVGMALGWW